MHFTFDFSILTPRNHMPPINKMTTLKAFSRTLLLKTEISQQNSKTNEITKRQQCCI